MTIKDVKKPAAKAKKPAHKAQKTNKTSDLGIKDALLLQALTHVSVMGWSEAALEEAAAELEIEADKALGLFTDLPMGMLLHCADWADREMQKMVAEYDLSALRVRDRVALLVRLRFEALTPYKVAIRSSLSILAQPQHMKQAAQMLWHTVDLIWNMAGDTSTDHNLYTKRGLLSGVYSAVLLRWLADSSESQEKTWEFLDRRIANVMTFGKITSRLTGFFAHKASA